MFEEDCTSTLVSAYDPGHQAHRKSEVEDHPALPTYSDFFPYLKAVGRGERLKRDLTFDEACEAIRLVLNGKATPAQIGGFLIAQRVKGEAVDEILGFTHVVREEFMRQITPRVEGLLDLSVPYDGKAKTAQLAPAVALILAEAGVPVMLHGDGRVPTKEGIGPGKVFKALGLPTGFTPTLVKGMIETVGIGYLGAKSFAPSWHALLPIRRQFGLRTVLNTVEKLLNPANAPYQISGFFHRNYIERIRVTQTGRRASWIVQGEEGSIEIATGRRTHIYGARPADDNILDPSEVGLPQRERISLRPVTEYHAQLNAAVLAGEQGPAAHQAALTAGSILHLVGAVTDLAQGLAQARHILASGGAQRRLEQARSFK